MLAQQQRGREARPEFAQTYHWLGDLYDQQGRTDDARRAWAEGLALFPNDARLRDKISTLDR